jgi:hypothetical protein
MLSFNISNRDLIECLYFANTIERGDRGWKEAQRQGYFMDNSIILIKWLNDDLMVVKLCLLVQGFLFFCSILWCSHNGLAAPGISQMWLQVGDET